MEFKTKIFLVYMIISIGLAIVYSVQILTYYDEVINTYQKTKNIRDLFPILFLSILFALIWMAGK